MSNFIKYLLPFLFIAPICAQTVTGTKNDNTSSQGWFNADNSLVIVLSSGDQTKTYKVKAFFSTNDPGDNTSLTWNNNTWIDLNSYMVGGICQPNSSSQCTWTITNAILQSANSNQQPADNSYVDFAVVRTDDSSPTSGEGTLIIVDNFDVSTKDALKFDLTDPTVSVSYPGGSSAGFNLQKITYSLSEAVIAGSWLRFDGDAPGVDTGNHDYNLAGSHLNAGSTTINTISFSSGGDLQEGGEYDNDFYLIDLAGNVNSVSNVRLNNVFDETRGRIASVATTKADGTYKIGDVIDVTLTFSEKLNTTGTMRVTFDTNDGGTDQHVDISSFGTRATTKTFNYTIAEGAYTSHLSPDALKIASIAMQSGALVDIGYNSTNDFSLTGDNLQANHALKIDGIRPTITKIESDKANGTYGIGEQINVTVTFSEAVTLSGGDIVITMETGNTDTAIPSISSHSGTTVSGVYTVVSGDASSDLTVKTVATTGALKDAAGNAMTSFAIGTNLAAQSGKTIVVETTRPTVTNITSTTNNGTYGVGDDVNVRVTFSEAVTLSGAGAKISVPLETGDTDATVVINSVSNSTTADGVYTVAEGHTTAGSDLTAKSKPVLVGTLKDHPAGNEIVDAGLDIPGGQNLADTKNIKIDAVYPTITNVTSTTANGTYKVGDDINLTLSFSEELTLASGGTLDITLNHGNTGNAKQEISAFTDKSSITATYTVEATDTTDNLEHTSIALDGTTLKDGGGNQPQSWVPTNQTLGQNKNIKIDGNRPSILKIRSSKPAGFYKVGDVIPIEIYFTEAVSTTAANILKATLETGSTNTDAVVTFGAIDNSGIATQDYTVRTNDLNPALTVNSIAVSGGQRVNDQAGNEMTDKSIPTGKNLADEIVDIYVDGVLPVDDGTAITMTTKGGNIVADKYNDTNTSVDFVVTIQTSDATLIGGSVQMQAKIAPNGWATIGDEKTISSGDVSGGKVTVNVLSAPIEALTGFVTDAVIKIKATVKDKAGNSKDWAESSNTLTIDVTRPTISSATSTKNTGTYPTGEAINITLGFSEDVKMFSAPLSISLNTTPAAVMNIPANEIDGVSTEANDYTVAAGQQTPDIAGTGAATLAVSSVSTTGGELRDLAGNPMALPVTSIGTKIADSKAISIDGIAPTALTVDTVIATGNTVRHGYFNGVNTGLKVHVPLTKTDNTLLDGKVRIKAKLSNSNTWSYIGDDWVTISSSELNAGLKIISLTKAHINNPFLQSEANVIEFTAGVKDKAGNETEWNKSAQTLLVDLTKPSEEQVTATITTAGGNVVANYWNSTNSSVLVKINFPTDATLEGGEVLLTTSQDGSSYSDFGDTTKITSGIYSAKTVTVEVDSVIAGDKLGLEEVNWFSEGDQLRFRAKVLDRAGNETHYTASNTTLRVKQDLPTVTSVTSTNDNKAYKAGEDLTIQVIMSEVVNVNTGGIPRLTLETGGTDAVATYTSGSTSNTLAFTYSIVSPHTTDDLNYFSKNALSVAGNNHVRDDYGNPIDPTLPDLDSNNSLLKKKDLVIDTTPPSVRFTYDDADSLVRKETGILVITATFSDSIMADSIPRITVDFPAKGTIITPGINGTATTGDIANQNMTLKAGQAGKIYTYNLSLVDNSDGKIKVSVDAKDKALNPIVADSTFDGDIVTIDNLDPVVFTTGEVTMFGDTVAFHWFNKSTDSVATKIPIDLTDNSLLRGNIQVQMQVDGKMASNSWETILPKDDLLALTETVSKYRTKKEILDILTPKNLAQGDTVFIRALLNDQVGNITEGSKSNSFFILDTIPPAVGVFADVAFASDTTLKNTKGISTFLTTLRDILWTNDTLTVGIRNWTDPKNKPTDIGVSGIQRYEYAVLQSADNDKNGTYSLFRSYKFQSDALDTVIVAVDSLRHNRNYKVRIQAYDVAGNQSANILSNSILRYNAKPLGEDIADVIAKEDILWEKRWKLTDEDLSIKDSENNHIGGTLLSDQFTYNLTTFKIDQPNTGDTTAATPDGPAAVNASGEISFTPTKLDTADFLFRVLVTDNWGLKDQIDFKITVLPVNDAPILDLDPLINTWGAKKLLTFDEGDSSAHMNITRYASDEDNDTTDLKYSFKIASTIPANTGYPIAKIGFLSSFGSDYKKSMINQLVDEFPASTIIQKNNIFLVYSANVEEFKDPIKVDSLSTKGVKDKSIDSLFTWIAPTDTTSADTNYYTESELMVEFSVIDPEGLIGKDTINFFINPKNDKPIWSGVRDTLVKENDSLMIDFANYLTDVDDSTLTITIAPLSFQSNVTLDSSKMSAAAAKTFSRTKTSYQYQSQARKDTVKIKPQPLWFDYENSKPRKGLWNPLDTLSNQIKFEITAADDEGASAIDTFTVKVQRVPRPEIRMYVVQNNAFTNYYEVFLVDSLGKTKDLTLEVQSTPVTLDTAAAFTYVGHYNFPTKGNYAFEVKANGLVGDTSIVSNVGLTLAKMYGNWSGKSADGQFQVIGQNGSVDFDQSVMILDSTLFEPYFTDRASYLLGNESFRFKKSVEVSLPGEEAMAIYSRSIGSGWVELPSITEGSRVISYTEKMGYFRLGPKTLIVPGQTSLQQNYPNPFNPSTTIEYDLGFVDGPYQKVNIMVYDILGRKIKLLVNEEKSIGRYQVKWDGKDHNGVPVSSGIYFINLITDMGRSQTKKVMLMR